MNYSAQNSASWTFEVLLWLVAGACACAGSTRLPYQVSSPDGLVAVRFDLRHEAGSSLPVYSISYRGRPILLNSSLGLDTESAGRFGPGFELLGVREHEHSGVWTPVYGERSLIPDVYREAVVSLRGPGERRLDVVLRAYNEGGAIRYIIPKQDGLNGFIITAENTEFSMPPGTRAWQTHGAQRQYENVWAKDIQPGCERPLTLEYPDGRYAALIEAAVRDYPRMLFSPVKGKPWTLHSELSSGPTVGSEPDPGGPPEAFPERADKPFAWVSAPFASPWRGVIVGDRPGDLVERNFLVLNLSPPPMTGDTSWIRPGKCIREMTLSTKGAKECIDFAKRHNLQYIEFDSGWYGNPFDAASDATRVRIDSARLRRAPEGYRGLDLPEVVRYASDNGIGVLLYVDRRAMEKQAGVILPLYQRWGVKGVKFGFVNVGSQYYTKWLYDTVELAAKHKLMVDIHDEHRPTGLSRTYPNLMTQEGIAGNETMPTPDHNTVLPFTRFLAGAADYTICYYSERIKTTRAHQLALAVVYYSPLQFLFWYDRPSAYNGEPEIEFFAKVPTVWDETKVVDGQIGRFAIVARRSGSDWFVGAINNGVPRRLSIPLHFLPKGRAFVAHVYEDGQAGRRSVKMYTREANADSLLTASAPSGGGQAIWLEALDR